MWRFQPCSCPEQPKAEVPDCARGGFRTVRMPKADRSNWHEAAAGDGDGSPIGRPARYSDIPD